jgi:hypothetical protein
MPSLTALAWLNVAAHALALVLALVGMRPGSPLVPLPERLHYLSGSPPGWVLGWATWMVCALVLVAFLAALAHRLPDRGPVPTLAVTLAAAGCILDLFCDAVYISVLPRLAGRDPPAMETFLAVEQLANVGGLVVANGMYALGALLLTLCLRGRPGLAPGVVPVGWGVFLSALVLVAAGFLGEPRLAEWGTGPTIGLFCVWVVLAARSLERPPTPREDPIMPGPGSPARPHG